MKTKHTPGPWRSARSQSGWLAVYSTAPNTSGPICRFGEGIDDDLTEDNNAEANARLIASAPALLAALAECVSILSRIPATDPNGELCGNMVPAAALTAIAAATGK